MELSVHRIVCKGLPLKLKDLSWWKDKFWQNLTWSFGITSLNYYQMLHLSVFSAKCLGMTGVRLLPQRI